MNNETKAPSQYSPLVLAYMGDAVYELYVRSRVIADNPNMQAHKLHLMTVKFVKAHSQAESEHDIADMLTEEETRIFKRGRNAKSPTIAKNATPADYRHATGFEALIGYLHLSGDAKRLNEIMSAAYESTLKKITAAK